MPLDERQRKLAALGAAIGANCRPCVERLIAAGRETGLSEAELAEAAATAEAVRGEAIELLSATLDGALHGDGAQPEPAPVGETSPARELAALGASVGANSHPLLHLHVAAALESGLNAQQIEAALKTAQFVQHCAAEITAEQATGALEQLTTTDS